MDKSMDLSRLQQLAATISSNTTTIHDYLQAHNEQLPAWRPGAQHDLPAEVSPAQDAALDAIHELYGLLISPINAFLAASPYNLMSINVVERFKIADSFDASEETSFERIAAASGLSPMRVKHIIRHAATMGVFRELRKGIVVHTPRSLLLRSGTTEAAFAACSIEDTYSGALFVTQAWEKWPNSDEPNETGYNLAHKTDLSKYDFIQQDPARAARFAKAMSMIGQGPGFAASHLARGYDWSQASTVVDLGGSTGHISAALAAQHPDQKFIVQDYATTIAGAAARLPGEVAPRISFMAHDFFQPQPIVADTYLFRWILHNWSDKYAIRILRALIPALRPGARVVINDYCLPEPGVLPLWKEREARQMDLLMMGQFNAYERDAEDWHALIHRVDPRFRLLGIDTPVGSHFSIIVAEWVGGVIEGESSST
ncbi:sterigmatocystin 8-O-methyltransferase [Aspergillus homomorphus CBS 101889]|uniref:Sterigmatocystin 8-O-methyltransferase n=1 Tax=Aspergillus homomorphus (strain CBS 101889) TaxID=1450537 RepID=A0A395HRL8_ASPHC|nr:sterigmatocystin 8-O-methyltransferase [Aspergillus homomorphus CBS 101889]RAL08884.1 sterigmatocystin 8-O-methyltransferase [Aspergillus homomorphus CBS 101889]